MAFEIQEIGIRLSLEDATAAVSPRREGGRNLSLVDRRALVRECVEAAVEETVRRVLRTLETEARR
ncbi:MAG: hypothetical protein KDD47_10775 [Acidobacteria bacterium]|nr:hypothetical protein [Acidobacteriota bacterium]